MTDFGALTPVADSGLDVGEFGEAVYPSSLTFPSADTFPNGEQLDALSPVSETALTLQAV